METVQGVGALESDPVGAAIARMLRALPEPEWDQERANRIFERVMAEVARREQRRRRVRWTFAGVGALLAGLSAPRLARRLLR